jgi:hypothetical protein
VQAVDFNDNFTTIKHKGKPKDPSTQQINENTESFRNFARRFRNSPVTKKDYTAWLRRFVYYCNLPDLLLFDINPKKIQTIIKNYIDYQYDRGLSPITVRGHYVALKRFYESNEVLLN